MCIPWLGPLETAACSCKSPELFAVAAGTRMGSGFGNSYFVDSEPAFAGCCWARLALTLAGWN